MMSRIESEVISKESLELIYDESGTTLTNRRRRFASPKTDVSVVASRNRKGNPKKAIICTGIVGWPNDLPLALEKDPNGYLFILTKAHGIWRSKALYHQSNVRYRPSG